MVLVYKEDRTNVKTHGRTAYHAVFVERMTWRQN